MSQRVSTSPQEGSWNWPRFSCTVSIQHALAQCATAFSEFDDGYIGLGLCGKACGFFLNLLDVPRQVLDLPAALGVEVTAWIERPSRRRARVPSEIEHRRAVNIPGACRRASQTGHLVFHQRVRRVEQERAEGGLGAVHDPRTAALPVPRAVPVLVPPPVQSTLPDIRQAFLQETGDDRDEEALGFPGTGSRGDDHVAPRRGIRGKRGLERLRLVLAQVEIVPEDNGAEMLRDLGWQSRRLAGFRDRYLGGIGQHRLEQDLLRGQAGLVEQVPPFAHQIFVAQPKRAVVVLMVGFLDVIENLSRRCFTQCFRPSHTSCSISWQQPWARRGQIEPVHPPP